MGATTLRHFVGLRFGNIAFWAQTLGDVGYVLGAGNRLLSGEEILLREQAEHISSVTM